MELINFLKDNGITIFVVGLFLSGIIGLIIDEKIDRKEGYAHSQYGSNVSGWLIMCWLIISIFVSIAIH